MTAFNKKVYLGTQPEYFKNDANYPAKVFCKIAFNEKGVLSISGVVGALNNGDCIGSCGQILDSININSFANGWDDEKLQKFIEIWRRWHLNDMNAATADMKAQGWEELARKEIFKYSYIISNESRTRRNELERQAVEVALKGESMTLSDEEKRLLTFKTSVDIIAYEKPATPEFMEPWTTDFKTKQHKIERKTLGWVSVEEHPDGLLGKELNGKKYGHAWYFEDVPADVIEWLRALPDASIQSAWI